MLRTLFLVILTVVMASCEGSHRSPPDGSSGDGGDGGDGGDAPDADRNDTSDSPDDTPDAPDAPDGPRPPAPPLYTPSELGDAALAQRALRILGSADVGGSGSCSECHGITRRQMRAWAGQAAFVLDNCITDQAVSTDTSAAAMVACLQGSAAMPRAADAGIFAAAGHLDWFGYVFEHGAGADWEAERELYLRWAAMPAMGRMPLTQAQFDLVASWFVRGAPEVDRYLPEDPPPSECIPFVSPETASHAAEMATTGWGALNLAAGIRMYGCVGATTPRDCLATRPAVRDSAYGTLWDNVPGSTIRLLHTTTYSTSYWTRSSADGRFVSHGPGYTIDLQRGVAISVNAPYDPAFFPDNSAFVWPGVVCDQALLLRNPTTISLSEPECESASIGLYEHLGVGLGGNDYWVITGEFSSDSGGFGPQPDPDAGFSGGSSQTFTRMLNDGSGFRPGTTVYAATPFEGDGTISPSSTLVMARIGGPGGVPIGYTLYRIEETPGDVALHEIGRYCFPGAKIEISFDERWAVTHHYIGDADAVELGFTGPSDPAFARYRTQGAANVYLVDLTTGARTRLTNMQPGQFALFPHFRSDGWIYFMTIGSVGASGGERLVATDAALVLAE